METKVGESLEKYKLKAFVILRKEESQHRLLEILQ